MRIRSAVKRTVQREIDRIAACASVVADAVVQVGLKIDGNGRAGNVIPRTTLTYPLQSPRDDCIRDAIRETTFPYQGRVAEIGLTFRFGH